MTKKIFEIGKVSLEATDLDALANTWDTHSEAERTRMLETAQRLVPKGMSYIVEEKPEKDPALKIALAAKTDQQLMLVGPKGTGKTTSIYHVAQETNNPLVPIQLNGSTGVDSLIGKWLVNENGTYWIDGLFTMAWRHGFWIILDELNMALPEITAILHPALDDRRILVLDEKNGEVIPRHPNCRIFAAINPTEDYAGTKEMNAALVDRFSGQVKVSYPEPRKEREIILAHRKVKIDDTPQHRSKPEGIVSRMVKVWNALRQLHARHEIDFECSTRNLIDWAAWASEIDVKSAFDIAIASKMSIDTDIKKAVEQLDVEIANDEQWTAGGVKARGSKSSTVAQEEVAQESVELNGF